MDLSNKLKQMTFGAVLSVALALLIIHPEMFSTALAQSTEGFYLPEPVDRIAPDLEDVDYGLNPFYAGRPISEEIVTPNVVIFGVVIPAWLVFTIGVFVGAAMLAATQKLYDALLGITNYHSRQRLLDWLNRTGFKDDVGKEYCWNKGIVAKSTQCVRSMN